MNNIEIRMVMNKDAIPAFVEYYDKTSKRTVIIKADRFCKIFGYNIKDLHE